MINIDNLIEPAFFVGASAVGAVLIGYPMGLAGGAVYGAFLYATSKPVEHLTQSTLTAESATGKTIIKILAVAAACAVAWQLTAACGFVMTFKAAVILAGCASIVYSLDSFVSFVIIGGLGLAILSRRN